MNTRNHNLITRCLKSWCLYLVYDSTDAERFAESVKEVKDAHGLDGIDLDVESAGAPAGVQIHLIKSVREKCGTDFHITYTIPALTESVEPWQTVMKNSIEYMDAINIMAYDVYWGGYDWPMDVSALEELGVPRVINKAILKKEFILNVECSNKKLLFFSFIHLSLMF